MTNTWLQAPDREAPAIRVGFVGSIGRACFSDLLLRAGPQVEIAFRTGSRKALLAALAGGRLDLAVHPGATPPGLDSAPLGEDRFVVALVPDHPLAGSEAVEAALLADWPVLLPVQGDDGDLRRLALERLPGLRQLAGRPMLHLATTLAESQAVALITAGQDDDLAAGLVTRRIAGADTHFPVNLAWSAARLELSDLVAAITGAALSPPRVSRPIPAGGGRGDGAGDSNERRGRD